jgi:hypothetical protein
MLLLLFMSGGLALLVGRLAGIRLGCFGASAFFSTAAGAGAATLAAGAAEVAGVAGVVPWAKDAEAKPAATVRATRILETCILILLGS